MRKTWGILAHRGNIVWGHREKTAFCKPRRAAEGETKPTYTLMLDSSPQNGEMINCYCLSHSSLVFCYGSSSRLIHFLSVFQSTLYVHINPLLDLNCLWFLGKVNLIFQPITPCCMHECSVSGHVQLCDPMDCSHQAPLSMGFSRQEYWSGLPCPSSRDLPDPGIEPASLTSAAFASRFFNH